MTTPARAQAHKPATHPIAGEIIDPTAALAYLAGVDTADKARAQLRRQAIRDARTAGAQITEIATTLGVRNRSGLYEILEETPPAPTPPAPTPTIFMRGAGADKATWAQVVDAMYARGWLVIRDRTQAWHLARGRVPTVLVDITHAQPRIGLIKARYGDDQQLELPAARPLTLLDTLNLNQLVLAVIDHLGDSSADKDPHVDQEPPVAAVAPDKTGVLAKRRMSLPEGLWGQVQQAITDGKAHSASQLISDALHILITKLERIHGHPYSPVDQLPAGRRTPAARGQTMRSVSITLDQAEWARARAVIAGEGAISMPGLFVRALQEHLASNAPNPQQRETASTLAAARVGQT